MSLLIVGGIFREVVIDEDGQRQVRLAGSAFYAANAAARLGAPVTMLAPVGSDDVDVVRRLADESGIDTQLVVGSGASGTFAYERRGGLCLPRGYRPADFRPTLDFLRLPAEPRLVLVFGHPEYDPTHSSGLSDLIHDRDLLFDRQGWMSATSCSSDALKLPAAKHLALINVGELSEELGSVPDVGSPPVDGWSGMVVKDGRWGVYLLGGDDQVEIPAHHVGPVDELGSGDVFAGAFAAALLGGSSQVEAAIRANAAAAVAVATSEVLAPDDLALRIDNLLSRGEVRPMVSPMQRARTEIVIDAPPGFAGDSAIERLSRELQSQGFRPSIGDRRVASATVLTANDRFELEHSDLDVLNWLQERLGSSI